MSGLARRRHGSPASSRANRLQSPAAGPRPRGVCRRAIASELKHEPRYRRGVAQEQVEPSGFCGAARSALGAPLAGEGGAGPHICLNTRGRAQRKSVWRTSLRQKRQSALRRFVAHPLATLTSRYRPQALRTLQLAIRDTLRVRLTPLTGLSSERVQRAREERRRRPGSGGRCGARAVVANEFCRARAAPAAAAHVRLTPRRLRECAA